MSAPTSGLHLHARGTTAFGEEATVGSDTGERAHVERSGVVPMALPFADAFTLFNAVGERRWVAGWDPRFVHPAEPRAAEGAVFQTGKKGLGTATWVQTGHEPSTGSASFVYVVPDHHAAMVDVGVAADGEGRSRASVRYRMTSLSFDADDFVRDFGETFEDNMAHWAEAIQRHIVEGVPLAGE